MVVGTVRSHPIIDIRYGGDIAPNGSLWHLPIDNPLNAEWPRRCSINTHSINPTPEGTLMPTWRVVYITQQYGPEQRNETKYSGTFDGLNWVSLSALLILIKPTMKHLAV